MAWEAQEVGDNESEALALQVLGWFREADECYQDGLPAREESYDYVEGRQLEDDVVRIMVDRGQPPTVVNKTRLAVELVMGIYDKTRMDVVMLPRSTHDDDWQTAQAATHGSKYLEDVNYYPHKKRQVFRDVLVGGLGASGTCLNEDPQQEDLGEEYVDWREVRYDPLHKNPDMSDARFFIRAKWLDLDAAKSMWPQHAEKLEDVAGNASVFSDMGIDYEMGGLGSVPQALSSNGRIADATGRVAFRNSEWIDTRARRVLILECWYYVYEVADFLRDKRTGRTIEYKPNNLTPAESALIMGGVTGQLPIEILRRRPTKRCRRCFMAGPHVLEQGPSPYNHQRIPYSLHWAWRDWRTGQPVGFVKALKDPQDAANKALSKLILALSTNQVLMEENSGDVEVLRKEAAKPNGFMIVKRNVLREGRFKIERNTADASAHQAVFQMFQDIVAEMSGGLELQGGSSGATSGRQTALRQEQGHTTLSSVFENFRFGVRLHTEQRLSNMQQFWTDEKYIRITESLDPSRQTVVVLNQRMGDGRIKNDMTSIKMDVVIDEQTARATVRQAFADKLMDFMLRTDPAVAMSLMDIAVDMYDLPDRPVIKRRIQVAMQMMGVLPPQGGGPGDTAQTARKLPADMSAGTNAAGYGPEVLSRLAAADAGPGANNRGQ